MSDTSMPSLCRRLLSTPLRDLARLRVSGRLNWKQRVRASGLPAAVQDTVLATVRRTWLTRLERGDVAAELLAHFHDGLAAGETAETLVADFGDVRLAARLIGRAKRRGRSWVTSVGLWMRRGVLTLIGMYALLAVRYFTGRPSPTRDYLAMLNAPALAVSEQQRAWPVYRQVLLDGALARDGRRGGFVFEPDNDRKGAEQWLREHASLVARLRDAAGRPALGYVLGPGGSSFDPQLHPDDAATYAQFGSTNMAAVQAALNWCTPLYNDLRRMMVILAADARLAARVGDGDRAAADLLALHGITGQLRRASPTLIAGHVALGCDALLLVELGKILVDTPSTLSDGQLRALGDAIAEPRVAADLYRLDGERWLFDDLVQRIYTDDGNGHGRFTPTGWQLLAGRGAEPTGHQLRVDGADTHPLELALGPLAMTFLPSRQDMTAVYDRLLSSYENALRRPARDSGSLDDALLREELSTLKELRYGLVLTIFPGLDRPRLMAELYLGERDGTVLAIATEQYRRMHGGWPSTLEALVPEFLPSLPVDRVTGAPLHYRVERDRPLVWSVGNDRADDNGRSARQKNGDLTRSIDFSSAPTVRVTSGDWVIFPPPPDVADEPTTMPARVP